jgi:hypothetical protein
MGHGFTCRKRLSAPYISHTHHLRHPLLKTCDAHLHALVPAKASQND